MHKLYCIVLYLYIYIAVLAVHTNQKRLQCERRGEKTAVLSEQKRGTNAHQLIKWIAWKEGVDSKAQGQCLQRPVSEP